MHLSLCLNRRSTRGLFSVGLLLASVLIAPLPAHSDPDPALQDLPPEYDLSLLAKSPAGDGSLRLSLDTQADGQRYDLVVTAKQISLLERAGKREIRLAEANNVGLADARTNPLRITFKRRAGSIQVLAGSRLVMAVEDNSLHGGAGSVASDGGAAYSELRVQPVEALYFTDDFMRQPTEPGEWRYLKGKWAIQTIGVVERGANPFSLESRPDPIGLAATGYSFWDNYTFEAAVKGNSTNAFGICAGLQDDANYYLLRWTPGLHGALELSRVVGGKPTVLAHRDGGFIPGQWYGLRLRLTAGHVMGDVDHEPVFNVADTTFGQGKIGLYSEGLNTVWFDSVLVHSANILYDDFGREDIHRWQDTGDRAVGGSPEAENYSIAAQTTGVGHTVGLILHYRDPENYYAFSSGPDGSRLVAVTEGKRRLLGESSQGIARGQAVELQAGIDHGYLWGAIGGKRVVEGLDFALSQGRAGFEPAAATNAGIQWLAVQTPEPPEPTDALTAEFTDTQHHREMDAWAGPLHSWDIAPVGNENGYWHKGHLFGDTSIKIPLDAKNLASSRFGVVLCGDGKTAASGYELDCQVQTRDISLTLLRQGEKVMEGHAKAPAGNDDTVALNIYRRGSFIYAGLGQEMALKYQDPHPIDGYALLQPVGYAGDAGGHSKMALVLRDNTELDIPSIVVNNAHVYAETFHLAPLNWRVQGGQWDVTRRWACQPGWTWYGGRSSGFAVNWHKTPLTGDQSIDYYTGAMMAAEQNAGNEAWRDLNCSFCSDGMNLFSGYTLIVCGWDGNTTRLFRKGHVVAESTDFQFPPQGVAHRLWFDVHVLKQGGQIKVDISYVDEAGQQHSTSLINWTDPDPLPGGHVGFWTWDNGMMLARVVLCSQGTEKTPLYAAQPTWLARLARNAPYPQAPDAGLSDHDLTQPMVADYQPPTADEIQAAAAPPGAGAGARLVAVQDQPEPLEAHGLSMTVQPGGTLANIQFHGKTLIRRVVLDIRTGEWHEVHLTAENSRVTVIHGDEPGVAVTFHVLQPELGMDVSGRETVKILPGGVLRLSAAWTPNSTFDSKRLSLNLVIPSADYQGKEFTVQAADGIKVIPVPDEPLFPIGFATDVKHLTLKDTGISVVPETGQGVFEDLRHYQMSEFWFEQTADYAFPQVPKGVTKSVEMEVRFQDTAAVANRL